MAARNNNKLSFVENEIFAQDGCCIPSNPDHRSNNFQQCREILMRCFFGAAQNRSKLSAEKDMQEVHMLHPVQACLPEAVDLGSLWIQGQAHAQIQV